MLTLNNVTVSFDNDTILENINLTINEGEIVCIIGPSGSGKSTLIRTMNHMVVPTSGTVSFKGEELTSKNINMMRQHIGMVFQSFNLFNNMTVLDNCMVGQIKVLKRSREEAKKHAMEYLEKLKGILEEYGRCAYSGEVS